MVVGHKRGRKILFNVLFMLSVGKSFHCGVTVCAGCFEVGR